MNVVKVIRNRVQPVKLIRQAPGQPIKLVRASLAPLRVVHTGGVVLYGGYGSAEELPCQTNFSTYYQLKKQA